MWLYYINCTVVNVIIIKSIKHEYIVHKLLVFKQQTFLENNLIFFLYFAHFIIKGHITCHNINIFYLINLMTETVIKNLFTYSFKT